MALKLAIFAMVIVFSNIIFYLALPIDPDNQSYLGAINDKYARLANTPAPRIIFVGTSDLAFGLDSAKVEDAFGMPIVNMGLHGGLGIRFSLESVRAYIEPGDILVVSANLDDMRDNLFYGQDAGTGVHLWLLKFRPSAVRELNSVAYLSLLPQEYFAFVKTMWQMAIATKLQDFYMIAPMVPDNPYRRSGFNEYGDLVAHLELAPVPFAVPQEPLPAAAARPADAVDADTPSGMKIDEAPSEMTEADIYFNEYHEFVLARGARIYAVSPPTLFWLAELQLQDTASDVTIPTLGLPTDYAYPVEYFYDTIGHLTKAGRAMRTEQLIDDLSGVIAPRVHAE